MHTDIAVYGAGGFGLEVAMLIEQINEFKDCWRLIGFFDDGKQKNSLVNHWPVLGGLEVLNHWTSPLAVVFAIGDPLSKKKFVQKVTNPLVTYPKLVHPSVICGPSTYINIGEGAIICAGTIITTNIEIGQHVIFNLACTVGHETEISDFCSFMPTCNISGQVKIGEASYWGTGAKVIQQRTIGQYTTIGAGAVVIHDIPDFATAVGVPAKVIKQENHTSLGLVEAKERQS